MNRRVFVKLLGLMPFVGVGLIAKAEEIETIEIPNYMIGNRHNSDYCYNELVANGSFNTDMDGWMINGRSAYTYKTPSNGVVVLEQPLSKSDMIILDNDPALITRMINE